MDKQREKMCLLLREYKNLMQKERALDVNNIIELELTVVSFFLGGWLATTHGDKSRVQEMIEFAMQQAEKHYDDFKKGKGVGKGEEGEDVHNSCCGEDPCDG